MKVELKLKQDIQVYDLVTTFAVSAPAPDQRLCTRTGSWRPDSELRP